MERHVELAHGGDGEDDNAEDSGSDSNSMTDETVPPHNPMHINSYANLSLNNDGL